MFFTKEATSSTDYITSQLETKVLLVEDNELVQLMHRELLTSIGCKVDIAAIPQDFTLLCLKISANIWFI